MEQNIVKVMASFDSCESFVREFCRKNPFSDPGLADEEKICHQLLKAIQEKEKHAVLGIFKDRKIVGLFTFLVLKEEKYLEMLDGLSDNMSAYRRMFAYLKEHFAGYHADLVFNPNNRMLFDSLKEIHAEFETEQKTMVYNGTFFDIDTTGVQLLKEPYISAYQKMHNTDLYWTAEKVLEAKDRFRTFIIAENGDLAGYLDVTSCFEENEPFDFLVKEQYRRKGYGRKLLAKALDMNRPKGMMLHVDVDNEPAIRLYESLGFAKAENQNSLVAHLKEFLQQDD